MLFNTIDYDKVVKVQNYNFRYVTKTTIHEIKKFMSTQTYHNANICYFGYVGCYMSVDEYGTFNGYRYLYKMIDGLLCIFTENMKTHSMNLFHTPIGNADYTIKYSVLRKCIKIIYNINGDKCSCKIDNCASEYLSMLNRKMLVSVNHYSDEFVFDTHSLQTLSGKSYRSVRYALNKFSSTYNYEFREYEDEDLLDAMYVYDSWCKNYKAKVMQAKQKGENYGYPIWDKNLFEKQLKYHREMGIHVYVLLIDDKMVGISGIAELCSDCSVILFEKCINDYVGITEFMWIEMLKQYPIFKKYECDGDGGKKGSGLYNYKMKFKPVSLSPCNIVTLNKKGTKITEAFFNKRA